MSRKLLPFLLLVYSFSALAQNEQEFTLFDFIVDGTGKAMPEFEAGLGTLNCNSTLGFKTILNQCGACNVTGVSLGYRVYKVGDTPGGFSIITAASTGSSPVNACQDETWENGNIQSNILQNLENGTYQLDIYFQSDGTDCDPNPMKSAEYSTTFTYAKEPVITFQPIDLVSCLGGDAFFKTSATGVGTLTYQWQISDNGATFTNLLTSSKFKDVDTKSFHLDGVGATDRLDVFRCLITDANGCTATTRGAKTEVNRFGSVSIPGSTLCEGIDAEFIANVTYGDTLSAQWEYQLFGSSVYMNVGDSSLNCVFG